MERWSDRVDRSDGSDRDHKRHEDAKRQEQLDKALERGLEETFPGSDPVSVVQPPRSPYDKSEPRKR
jgi:hypothetical protein